MRLRTYNARSLLFFWRTNLAVVLGAAVGAAALTGALMVGDSMRASLQEVAVGRLGRVDHALVALRFFREALAYELATSTDFTKHFESVCPIILLNGGATHADRRTRVNQINLFGMDSRFWKLTVSPSPSLGKGEGSVPPLPTGSDEPTGEGGSEGRGEGESPISRSVILNQALADELGAHVGDDVLIRTGKPDPIASETLLGRRDETVSTLRVTVLGIIPAEGLGAFSLNPRQSVPKNAYVPLSTLQRALHQPDRVNALLVAGEKNSDKPAHLSVLPDYSPWEGSSHLNAILHRHITPTDLGLRLRVDEPRGYLSLESDSILLPPSVEEAAKAAASVSGMEPSLVLAHLANTIAKTSSEPQASTRATGGLATTAKAEHAIPYSTVVALAPYSPLAHSLNSPSGRPFAGEILLNSWAAEDLQAKPGDSITMSYYITGAAGTLETRNAAFTLRGIVPLDGPAADPGLIPEYKGITDTENLADWDPPFPVDLRLIRDKDEDYWDKHRTTPKAFVSLADSQRLWANEPERFGRLTSIRLIPASENSLQATTDEFSRELLSKLRLDRMGFQWDPVRRRITEASQGNTDFGMLFIGFSSFLILSAMMLVALLFRLGIERRAHEIGLLLGTGFSPRTVTRLLLTEAAALAVIGAVVGLFGASAYAWLMLAGLRSWWSDAVHTPFLQLHGSPRTLAIGFFASVLIASASAAWSIRGMTRRSPRSLLAGTTADAFAVYGRQRRRLATLTALVAFTAAITFVLLPAYTDALPKSVAFFLAGAAMLTACLALLARCLRVEPRAIIHTPGPWAAVRLGLRNAPRHLGRSMLTAGLIASATFVIISLEAFRLDADSDALDRRSGTGGFTLYAESVVPLPYGLHTVDGREALNVTDPIFNRDSGVTVVPFRLRPGDESSCLNLYQAAKPRILGVSDAMIQRGGFRFASSLAATDAERENPWTLLNRTFPDGAIAAIGDEAAVRWQLHLDLGKDFILEDERGQSVRLRFVALLKGSALQSELLVADSQFVRLFPSLTGHGFFLIDAPVDQAAAVESALERELERFNFDAAPTARRLSEFLAVQNTYISTFQTLGGIGLLLGTAGLAAVILRNIWERRRELALMRILGFSRPAVASLVLSENAALLVSGLFSGALSALVAIAPTIAADPWAVSWPSLALAILAVFSVGALTGIMALIPAAGTSVLGSLRSE